MSTSLKRRQNITENIEASENRWTSWLRSERAQMSLYWIVLALLILAAVLMRLAFLDAPFDRDSYDEGVYWQSLRAMLGGQGLYHAIFYSQPPFFLLSIFPGFALFGGTLWAARLSLALLSLLGFIGVYLLGKALAGRVGILVALALLLLNSVYLVESQTIQAEAPSVAFLLLTIGLAFLWWEQPEGRRGICWAALTAIALVLSVFSKLLSVTLLVPIAWLIGARIWRSRRGGLGERRRYWPSVLIGLGVALLTLAALLLPFKSAFADLWSGVVTFHNAASQVTVCDLGVNYSKLPPYDLGANFLKMAPQLFSFLGLPACYGIFSAFVRKDWRVLPLLAWLLVTVLVLLFQNPLFQHHLIALVPPFIALAVLGFAGPSTSTILLSGPKGKRFAPLLKALPLLLFLTTLVSGSIQDSSYYSMVAVRSTDPATINDLRTAADLRQAITEDQWVITDGQFIAGLADRSTPPSLVDTSIVRFCTGYLTSSDLVRAASDPRVHAVLFYSDRFLLPDLASFHTWVGNHFHLQHTYNPGQELWVR